MVGGVFQCPAPLIETNKKLSELGDENIMVLAETNRYRTAYHEESTWAEIPSSPVLIEIPITKQGLGVDKGTNRSNRIRNDYNPGKVSMVSLGVSGPWEFELEYSTFDVFFQHLLRNDPVVHNIVESTISFAATGQIVADSGGDAFAACAAGQWLNFAGAYNTENNGLKRIVSVASGGASVVVAGGTAIVDELAGAVITAKSSVLRNGVIKKSLLIEQQFLDISEYIHHPGCRVVGASLNVPSNDFLTGSFNIVGQKGVELSSSIGASTTVAAIKDPLVSSVNVGSILMNGVPATISIKSISLNIAGNERTRPVVDSLYSNDFGLGSIVPSGSMEVYFENEIFYDMYRDHTAFSLSWRATDDSGNAMVFTLPECYLTTGKPDFGKDDDVILPMAFECSEVTSGSSTYVMQIDSFAA